MGLAPLRSLLVVPRIAIPPPRARHLGTYRSPGDASGDGTSRVAAASGEEVVQGELDPDGHTHVTDSDANEPEIAVETGGDYLRASRNYDTSCWRAVRLTSCDSDPD